MSKPEIPEWTPTEDGETWVGTITDIDWNGSDEGPKIVIEEDGVEVWTGNFPFAHIKPEEGKHIALQYREMDVKHPRAESNGPQVWAWTFVPFEKDNDGRWHLNAFDSVIYTPEELAAEIGRPVEELRPETS